MDIVVKGRNVAVPDHYREHVRGKLARLERYDRKTIRFDVELFHERNPRQAKNCQRVEITAKGRGPAVRSEASASDFYAALDAASSKLENRLRRMHDRRKVHYGRRNPVSVAEATHPAMASNSVPQAAEFTSGGGLVNGAGAASEAAGEVGSADEAETTGGAGSRTAVMDTTSESGYDEYETNAAEYSAEVPSPRWESNGYEPGRIVREKEHTAQPMTVDQALYQMELVGHDFYLFSDADSGRPSVVYRRRGFDYGVIRLV